MDYLKVVLPSLSKVAHYHKVPDSDISSRSMSPTLSARYLDSTTISSAKPDQQTFELKRNVRRLTQRKYSENTHVTLLFKDPTIPFFYRDFKAPASKSPRKVISRQSVSPEKPISKPDKPSRFNSYSRSPSLRPNSVSKFAGNQMSPLSNGGSPHPVYSSVIKASSKRSYKSFNKPSPYVAREPRRRPSKFIDFSFESFFEKRRGC